MGYLRSQTSELMHVTFVASDQSPMFFQPSDLSYSAWLRNYKRVTLAPMRIAEMFSVRNNAVLLVRDRFSSRRIILAGRDPLIYRASTGVCDVLHFTRTDFLLHPDRMYVRCSGTLTIGTAEELYLTLQDVFPAGVYVQIRNDQWFFGSLAFPQAYWYDLATPPENPEIVLNSLQIECYPRTGRLSPCSEDRRLAK
jgi:hypothetical protein